MVLAEAMGAGLPIVASDSGAIPEVLAGHGAAVRGRRLGRPRAPARGRAARGGARHAGRVRPAARAQLLEHRGRRPARGRLRRAARRMRILLALHHALDRNAGAPGATLELGAAYATLGHEVEYLTWDDLPRRLSPRAKELLFPELLTAELLRRERHRSFDVVDASAGCLAVSPCCSTRVAPPLLVTRAHGLEHRFWEETTRESGSRSPLPLRTQALSRTRAPVGGGDVATALATVPFPDRDDLRSRSRWTSARAHVGRTEQLRQLPRPAARPAGRMPSRSRSFAPTPSARAPAAQQGARRVLARRERRRRDTPARASRPSRSWPTSRRLVSA